MSLLNLYIIYTTSIWLCQMSPPSSNFRTFIRHLLTPCVHTSSICMIFLRHCSACVSLCIPSRNHRSGSWGVRIGEMRENPQEFKCFFSLNLLSLHCLIRNPIKFRKTFILLKYYILFLFFLFIWMFQMAINFTRPSAPRIIIPFLFVSRFEIDFYIAS